MDLNERIEALKSEVAALTAILDRDGLMSTGYNGQVVAHPAVAQRHAGLALLHKLEARLVEPLVSDPLAAFLAAGPNGGR